MGEVGTFKEQLEFFGIEPETEALRARIDLELGVTIDETLHDDVRTGGTRFHGGSFAKWGSAS